MANRHRGETAVEIGGQRYTLVYTINAICEMETLAKRPLSLIGQEAALGYVTAMRWMVWGGLRRHHPVSVEEAGDLLDALVGEVGTAAAGAVLQSALQAAFPSRDEAGPEADAPGKTTAPGGGPTS